MAFRELGLNEGKMGRGDNARGGMGVQHEETGSPVEGKVLE